MIVFAWEGFPQYAARCVGAFVKTTNEPVAVVATRPTVPIKGMEELCGCPVRWIDDGPVNLGKIDTLFVSGWGIPAFNRLRDEVRANGGRVIGLVDNNFIFSFKEILRAIRFRLCIRRHYDAFMVPGKSGRKLLRFYGVPDKKICEGLYTADETLFNPEKVDVTKKERRIVYVGQYIDRKNVLAVCRAFEASGIAADRWSLEMYGSGPLKAQIPYAQPFVQPEHLPEIYRRAKVFMLASKDEHWGLVVHEAALCGCYLMLSDRVGAADDLLGSRNGVKFDPFNFDEMTSAFRRLAAMSEAELQTAGRASLEIAKSRGLESFVKSAKSLVD